MVKKVLYSVIGVVVLGFVLLLIIGLNTPQPIKQAQQTVPTQNSVAVATSSVLDKQKVVAILSASVTYYTQLFATGKATLGTTQYVDAYAGVKAFDDPNSAAVRFGAFNTDTCMKNDQGANVMNAYRTVSDLYYSAGISSTDDLDNWSYDLNSAVSDICLWAGDAVSWQIKEVSTTKLHADEQKVTDDLTKAHADIQALAK